MTELTATVPSELSGLRLDQALARMFPDYSRSRIKDWIVDGAVTVDGETRRPRDPVSAGETIAMSAAADPQTEAQPEALPLTVLHEDDHVVVIDKPAGMVVHPGAGNPTGTLMNGLLYRYPELDALPRAGIVHRLDKDTSGLLVVARSLPAHTSLVRQLAERQVSRRYQAICVGTLTGGGTIDAPIRRHPVDRLRMAVRDGGKPAITHYRVVSRFSAHTHVSVQLETGRTHQIRVHFQWRGYPLVGDPQYGGRRIVPRGASDRLIRALDGFGRQALCATELAFLHPDSGETCRVETEPAADFVELCAVLAEEDATP